MRAQPKLFPQNPSLDLQRGLLLRPESNPTRYQPFENADRFPFEPHATEWSRVNAWWLAEAAWLAYWHNEADVRRVFQQQAGLPTCELIAAGGTECYVGRSDSFAIVAFRGTQPDDWVDIFDDARYLPVPWDAGHVHLGFAEAFERVRERLDNLLGALPSGCRVWCTGHSLGAALATLAAYRYRQHVRGVYTFGSPRVGNDVFARSFGAAFERCSIRYENDHDVVTRVPPEPFALPHGLYTHVGQVRSIDQDGQVGTTPRTLEHFVRDVFGRTNVLLDLVELDRQRTVQIALPDALTDHTPLYYVLHCWNDFALHGVTV